MWAWQKQLVENGGSQELTTVTALSVNPSGSKVACYGYDWPLIDSLISPSSKSGYIFVLDTSNGAIVSSLLKMEHSVPYLVQSKAFILRDNGDIFLTLGIPAANDMSLMP